MKDENRARQSIIQGTAWGLWLQGQGPILWWNSLFSVGLIGGRWGSSRHLVKIESNWDNFHCPKIGPIGSILNYTQFAIRLSPRLQTTVLQEKFATWKFREFEDQANSRKHVIFPCRKISWIPQYLRNSQNFPAREYFLLYSMFSGETIAAAAIAHKKAIR